MVPFATPQQNYKILGETLIDLYTGCFLLSVVKFNNERYKRSL